MAYALKSKSPAPPLPAREIPPGPISYADFIDWLDDETHAEWVNGEVVLMTPISFGHNAAFRLLHQILAAYAGKMQCGEVMSEPFQMKTGPELPGRSPDIFFVANENLSRFEDNCLHGPADLVVEIISPDSVKRDRIEKFAEYQAGGVREYWIIDPTKQKSQFFVLAGEGLYTPVKLDPDGIYHSTVLDGLWIREEWLWRRPQLDITQILREWGWF